MIQKFPYHQMTQQHLKVKEQDFTKKPFFKEEEIQMPPDHIIIPEMFLQAVSKYEKLPFMEYRAGLSTNATQISNDYQTITYENSTAYINQIVQQLKSCGIQAGDKIAIYGKNSPLWFLSALSISFADGVVVPLYDTLGIDNIQYCLNFCEVKAVFVSNDYIHNILGMIDKLKTVKNVIAFDSVSNHDDLIKKAEKVFLQIQGDLVVPEDNHSLYSMVSRKSNSKDNQKDAQDSSVPFNESYLVQFEGIVNLVQSGSNNGVSLKQVNLPSEPVEPVKLELPKNRDDKAVCQIMFTSGTAGRPKAVVQSHENVIWGPLDLTHHLLPPTYDKNGNQNKYLSYLPLAHIFEIGGESIAYQRGYCISYSSGNIKLLSTDIALSKPSIFFGVPRVYQKIYNGVVGELAKKPAPVRGIFWTVFYIKWFLMTLGFFKDGRFALFDKTIFKAIIGKLGGNMNTIISSSSALADPVLKFLRVCTGAHMCPGYGITETCGSGLYVLGGQKIVDAKDVGWSASKVEVILIDRSDASEFSLQKDQIGEMCIRCRGTSLGYMMEDKSVQSIKDADGFFHTGDLMRLNADGSVSFVRRVTQVVKLQHGEFVDLEQVAAAVEADPRYICCYVHAEADKPAPLAVVSVALDAVAGKLGEEAGNRLKALYQEAVGAEQDEQRLWELQRGFIAALKKEGALYRACEAQILKDIDYQVRLAQLKGFNVPKAVAFYFNCDWTWNRELFTPSQKKQHRGFRTCFAQEIAALWKLPVFQEGEAGEGGANATGNRSKAGTLTLFLVAAAIMLALGKIGKK